MAFDVYPSPTHPVSGSTDPLNVPGATTSAAVTIVEHFGPDNVATATGAATNWPETMFIRVVKQGNACGGPGGATPTVHLAVDGGNFTAIQTGSAVNVNSGSETVGSAIMGIVGSDVFLVKIILFSTGHTWQIQIQNNDGSPQNFAWVVGTSDAEASQPWIDVESTAELGNVLTGQTITHAIQVANRGTGDLTITDTVGDTIGSDFTITAVPGAILPNTCGNIQVELTAPSSPQQVSQTYTIGSNDTEAVTGDPASEHNGEITLNAEVGRLEVVFLLDGSGSMAWKPDGSSAISPSDSRWSKMGTAAKQCFDILEFFGGGMGRFAMGVFPDITTSPIPSSASSAILISAADIDTGLMNDARNEIDTNTPSGGTPMGHGIEHVIGGTPTGFGEFLSDSDSQNFNHRWLVLMSDGYHNHPPPNPEDFLESGSKPSFSDKSIRVITIGYGDPGGLDVNHDLLAAIASGSDGKPYEAGINDVNIDPGSGLSIHKAFRTSIVDVLALDPTVDPAATLHGPNDERRHSALLLPFDNKVAFVVTWSTFDPERVLVQLLTPGCELITPERAGEIAGVDYRNDNRYAIYTISGDYLHNSSDPSNPRHGTWTLIVTGTGLNEGETEAYEYEVVTDSRLKLNLSTDRTQYYAGDGITLTARLTLDGLPVENAGVTLYVTAPGQAASNWVAAYKVTPQEFQDASDMIQGVDKNIYQVKALALKNKGLTYLPLSNTQTIVMNEQEPGVYVAHVSNNTVPGTYDLYVTAVGQAEGVSFRREQRRQIRVQVRPVPDYTILDILYDSVFLDDRPFINATVRVQPRDRFGNVVLVDPAIDNAIQLDIQGGQPSKALQANLDGSYTRVVRYSSQEQPAISLRVGGQQVIRSQGLIQPTRLAYPERILDYKRGLEARDGINQHVNPEVLLQPLTKPNEGQFLALGGNGSVTVGLRDKSILPGKDGDITVFLQPGENKDTYEVEALAPRSNRWVSLGKAEGITKTFNLRDGGLKAADAVRITDLSGRTYEQDLKPSTAPGVGIRGVGFAVVGRYEEPKPGGKNLGCLGILVGSVGVFIGWLLGLAYGSSKKRPDPDQL